MDTKCVIKRKQFKGYPMPEPIKQRMNVIGKENKQDGQLKFANWRNVKFDWIIKNESTSLMEENTIEQETRYPDILVEMPGILTEE